MTKSLLFSTVFAVFFQSPAWGQIRDIVVTSAAAFQPGVPAKGSLGTLFCGGLTVAGTASADMLPLPLTLAGVSIMVGGAAAPLLAVADFGGYQQINFQVPSGAELSASTPIVVTQGGRQGTASAAYDPNAPGEFFRISGTEFGIFQHATDYSLVTPEKPGTPGETVIAYLTGLPPAPLTVPDGQATPLVPLHPVNQLNLGQRGPIDQIGIYIGTAQLWDQPPIYGDSTGMSPVTYIGLAPGSVGVYQINFTLPLEAPVGNLSVQAVRWRCTTLFGASYCAGEVGGGGGNVSRYYHSPAVLLPVGRSPAP